MFTTN